MFLQYYDFEYFIGVFIFFIVVVLAIDVGIAIWVYRDAQNRDMDAIIWLLVVIVGGCLGCIVYLIISKDYPVRESADWYKRQMKKSGQPQDREFDQQQRPI
jgi:hypothetical protein